MICVITGTEAQGCQEGLAETKSTARYGAGMLTELQSPSGSTASVSVACGPYQIASYPLRRFTEQVFNVGAVKGSTTREKHNADAE